MGISLRAAWIEWTRTLLTPSEVDAELACLSPGQRAVLEDQGWLWEPGRVLWRDPTGAFRRARFTHGTHFCTEKGLFHVDSAGTPVLRG